MKYFNLLFLCLGMALPLYSENIPMPPAMPSVDLNTKNDLRKIEKKVTKKSSSKNSCSLIPPMIVNLPPMLEDDLEKCKNSMYLPTKTIAEKKLKMLLKKEVKVNSVEIVNGFSMLYKIDTNKGIYYCNKKIDKCLFASVGVIE